MIDGSRTSQDQTITRFYAGTFCDQRGMTIKVTNCNPYESFQVVLIDAAGRKRLQSSIRANKDGVVRTTLPWAGVTDLHRLVITSNSVSDTANVAVQLV